ncbi:universal stress protein family protein [Haloplanus aerogenes]|uniref:Universal stress protein family protein n=1 Tax=Haloplanus aerogenes TaxID=660522 RepID=A0A3M0CFJ2_9EURY|nr:universal stress protein family protein [Haloplanus aerogenes]
MSGSGSNTGRHPRFQTVSRRRNGCFGVGLASNFALLASLELASIALGVGGVLWFAVIESSLVPRPTRQIVANSVGRRLGHLHELDDAGIEPTSKAVEYGPSIHKVILTYIEEHDIDLVVVGTHGRTGFDRYVLGSVTDYLVRTSPIPVLTARAPPTDT